MGKKQGCPACRKAKARFRTRPELDRVYFLYSVLMGVAALVSLPYWLVKGLRHGKYLSNLGERLGMAFPGLGKATSDGEGAIWLHAVSVGEALSAVPLAKKLKEKYPKRRLIVSTTTLTGQALAKERMAFADGFVYFPFDWAFCVRRFLDAIRPSLVLVLETEIWPNFLRETRRRNVPVVFLSGRISDKSFARYQKYLGIFGFYLKPFLASVLAQPAAFLMQTEEDAKRLLALGAPRETVKVSGNLKFDMEVPAETPLSSWLAEESKRTGRWPVIVAGSVVATEEPLALIAFGVVQGDFPKALLVLAPRKPERFGAAADFIEESHRKFVRRTELGVAGPGNTGAGTGNTIPDDATVVLLDSIGELASLYRHADGVLIGGSLVESGGHNLLEPAAFGKVPVFGESMENFAAIAARFLESGAAIQVGNPEDAGVEWIHLLKDKAKQERMGNAAREIVEKSRGALARAMSEIEGRLGGAAR